MTRGDRDSIRCPFCEKTIHIPLDSHEMPERDGCRIVESVKPCPHCKTMLRYWGRWRCMIECEMDCKTL